MTTAASVRCACATRTSAFHRTVAEGRRRTPALIELDPIFQASRALERGQETAADVRYLQGKGTSLGGIRPKCTVLDEDGWLSIGKFPSVGDTRSVTRGEVLALRLASQAGIDTVPARIGTGRRARRRHPPLRPRDELDDFAPAFEHEQMEAALALLRR